MAEDPQTAPAEETVTVSGERADEAASSAKPTREPMSFSRRTACIGVGSLVAMAALGSLKLAGHTSVIRPPGGQDENVLIEKCIRCERCFEACPMDVIAPCAIENGFIGMRTPELKYSGNYAGDLEHLCYCDFCTQHNGGVPRCVEVCPTNALELDEGATEADTIIGIADIDTALCMAWRGGNCRYCYDACMQARGEENAAVYLQGTEPDWRPYVDAGKCNGCGACEAVCISLTEGSISTSSAGGNYEDADTSRRAIKVLPAQGA